MFERTRLALASWIMPKAMPRALAGGQWFGTNYTDLYKRNREPTANELMAELKGTAWTCASLNASVCANYYPRLFVTTQTGQSAARAPVKALDRRTEEWLRSRKDLPARWTKAAKLQEVTQHVLLDLFQTPNPFLSQFDLWELTTLYQEVVGNAYWQLEMGPLGVPVHIWVMPAQNMSPGRDDDSPNVIDWYTYQTGKSKQYFKPEEILHFRYPDPRNPYAGGLSPLRASIESVNLTSHYNARRSAIFEQTAVPDAIVTPAEVIGDDERERLEMMWNQRFRRGGAGRALVTESPMKVQLLRQSMGDLALLAEQGATKEDVANAFHVPMSYLTRETNMANIQAAHQQHMMTAISPRLSRRDERVNNQLVPLFDPTGRLFCASEDPVPVNLENQLQRMDLSLKYGVVTINEVRQEQGMDPVPWGEVPWLPLIWERTDFPRRVDEAADSGRNKPPGHAPQASHQDQSE
jgi:HK97 family phage portal protein